MRLFGVLLLFAAGNVWAANFDEKAQTKSTTIELEDFNVDRPFLHMNGITKEKVWLPSLAAGTVRYWVKSMNVEILDANRKPLPRNFMCHAWLRLRDNFYDHPSQSDLIVTVSFPPGFGVPLSPSSPLDIITQAVNDDPNFKGKLNFRVTVNYLEDQNKDQPLLVPLQQLTFRALGPKIDIKDGAICDSGKEEGEMASHFIVPPGKHSFEQPYAKGTVLRHGFIHAMKVHLHKYGDSVTLTDVTAGKKLWVGKAHYQRGEMVDLDSYSDDKGIEVFPDHAYKVVTVYNNTTKSKVDGMATLRTYVHYDGAKVP